MERQTHTIDAAGKILGRLATEIAILLRGKQRPGYIPNIDAGDFIVVKNIGKIKVTGKKFKDKIYYHHTGYLGGIKAESFEKLFSRRPAEVLRKAVWGMLPKNKLRAKQIKRLKILNNE